MPDCPGEPVVTTLVCFFYSHTGPRVRLSTRHSLRPLTLGAEIHAALGRERAAGMLPRVPGAAQHERSELMRCRTGTHPFRRTNRSRFCEAALHAASRPGHEEGSMTPEGIFNSTVIVREHGRSSIPETLTIEPRGRSVLDTAPSRVMTLRGMTVGKGSLDLAERLSLLGQRLGTKEDFSRRNVKRWDRLRASKSST
jgi:hypothetical protein